VTRCQVGPLEHACKHLALGADESNCSQLLHTQLELEAEVGIGLNYPLLRFKYARFYWLLNINQLNPA
jgi:hypothetical protein